MSYFTRAARIAQSVRASDFYEVLSFEASSVRNYDQSTIFVLEDELRALEGEICQGAIIRS